MDLMYIAHSSFLEDLRICFATVKILFMKESTEGVAEGAVTALESEAPQEEPTAEAIEEHPKVEIQETVADIGQELVSAGVD